MRDAVAGQTWGIEIGLQSQASPFLFKQNPTIASGDWKRSIVTAAGSIGALTNLDNLPTVSPSSSQSVSIILSASETTAAGAGGHINIWGIDATGAEWSDVEIIVDVVAVSLYSAVPAAAAGANGGLPTVDSSNAVKLQSGTGANQISLSSGLVTLANGSLSSAKFATDAIDANALKADAIAEIQSGLATPTNITAGTITTVTNLTNAPTVGDLTAAMKASVTTAATAATPTAAAVTGNVGGNVTGSVGSVSSAVTVGTINANVVNASALAADAVAEIIAAMTAPATPANITSAQTAIINAINALNNLSLANVASALATYDGATQADLDAAKSAILAAITTPPTAATIADMVNSRGMSHIDGAAEKYSPYHLIMSLLNGKQAAGTWIPYTTTGAQILSMAVPVDTDIDALPVVGTHGA